MAVVDSARAERFSLGELETIVKVEVAAALVVEPVLNPRALTVVVLVSERAAPYAGDEDEGSEPSRVYRIVAPEVAQEIVTCTPSVKVPAAGEMAGVATVSVGVGVGVVGEGLGVGVVGVRVGLVGAGATRVVVAAMRVAERFFPATAHRR
jgi:hypothetical protein